MSALEVRTEKRGPFTIAGLFETYRMPDISGIPAQWQRFAPHLGKVPGQAGWICYGICRAGESEGTMEYICAVEVTGSPSLPAPLRLLEIEAQRYAVFSHREHITKIKSTWDRIFSEWLPASGEKLAAAPQFEVYGPEFDPDTGTGLVEIWIPVQNAASA